MLGLDGARAGGADVWVGADIREKALGEAHAKVYWVSQARVFIANLDMYNTVASIGWWCFRKSLLPWIPELIEIGTKVNLVDELYAAAGKGELPIVIDLLNKSAEVDRNNEEGMVPLYAACKGGHIAVFDVLVARGADIKQWLYFSEIFWQDCQALHLAAENNNAQMIKHLLDKYSIQVDMQTKGGVTALDVAVIADSKEAVEALLHAGADRYSALGKTTCLHIACEQYKDDIIEVLLKYGAEDINQMDDDERTPLAHAIRADDQRDISFKGEQCRLVKMLLEAGADISLKTPEDKTAIDLAREYDEVLEGGCADIIKILSDHAAALREREVEGVLATVFRDGLRKRDRGGRGSCPSVHVSVF